MIARFRIPTLASCLVAAALTTAMPHALAQESSPAKAPSSAPAPAAVSLVSKPVPAPLGVDPDDSLPPEHVFMDIKSPADFGLTEQEIKIARGWLRQKGLLGKGPEARSPSPTESMPTLSHIENTEDSPYCMHVRLISPRWQCSGALIGPRHVITAAHCVSDGDGTADYAVGSVVTPGFDDNYAPYGTATVIDALLWSDWENHGDWDSDIAILELDRPIGALSGWFGYGSNNSASFYRNTTFYMRGYPNEGSYDGTDMYSRSGSFDSTDAFGCDTCWGSGREVRVNNRGYHGESGSGAYAVVGGDRVIYAVMSNGNTDHFDCVRFNSNRFDEIRDYISAGTSASVDLVPLDFSCGSWLVRAGSSISYSYTLINNSRATRSSSASLSYSIRLSTNNTISTADTPLVTGIISSIGELDPNEVTVRTGTITIPATTPPGGYYIGVVLSTSDADTGNNDSSGQDAYWISVYN